MKKWQDLNKEEKEFCSKSAIDWYQKHKHHVDQLTRKYNDAGYAPSGSDMFNPELFKPAHWKWFFSEI